MVKHLLIAAAALVITTPLFAQRSNEPTQRHEITASYGALPATGWADAFGKTLLGMFVGLHTESTDWGSVTVGYGYRMNSMVSIGAQLVYASGTETATLGGTRTTADNTYWSVMPSVKLSWLNSDIVSLYSRMSIGVTHQTASGAGQSATYTGFAFQCSPIGIEVGNRFAGYAEAGVGVSGSIIAGVRYRF